MHTIFCHFFSVKIKELVWWWEESVANQTQEEMGASEGGTKRERGTVCQKSNTQVQNTHRIETGFQSTLQLKNMLQGLSLLEEHEDLLQKLRVQKAEEYNIDKIKMDTEVQVNLIIMRITL